MFITNKISLLLTWILVKTRITPNQVTVASIVSGLLCGLCYAFGWFVIGSIFLFISHILDCTDGNLARVKEMFNPFGKWLDMIGDRLVESVIFIGVGIYFFRNNVSAWLLISLISGVVLSLYFYIVDISLTLGISKQKQTLTSIKFKDVSVKWGIMEPVIYGFIILTPLGLAKVQVILTFLLCLLGLAYQFLKTYSWKK